MQFKEFKVNFETIVISLNPTLFLHSSLAKKKDMQWSYFFKKKKK